MAFALTAGPDAAAVLLDDIAADVQAEAHARDLQLLGVAGAAERLEDALGGAGGRPIPRSWTSSSTPRAFGLHAHPQLGAIGRVFERVVEQIGQHLLDPIGIGGDRAGLPTISSSRWPVP